MPTWWVDKYVGDTNSQVEAQRVHLGGDEEHSVLVKGLDFALLAKRKAELEREKLDKMDDELEGFGREIGTKKGKEKHVVDDKVHESREFAGRVSGNYT